jgi:hypothetical protein
MALLDTLVIKNGKKLEFDVYRKPTDVSLCIPADSHHPNLSILTFSFRISS